MTLLWTDSIMLLSKAGQNSKYPTLETLADIRFTVMSRYPVFLC